MRTIELIIGTIMLLLALPMLYVGFDLAVHYHTLWIAPIPCMLCVITAGIKFYEAENHY